MALTVRLTPHTERVLDSLARRRRQTRSDIVREAIEHYAAISDRGTGEQSPYEVWADVVGIVRTSGRDSKRTTGELFTKLVDGKFRARRTR
jgi:Arc/MetJ-type ribon-helix-helix transcriptional regulator